MAVEIRGGADFQAGVPQALFPSASGRAPRATSTRRFRTASASSFAAPLGRDAMSPTTIVLNWPAGLGK